MEDENRSFRVSGLLMKIILIIVFILFTVWLLSLSNRNISNSLDVLKDEIFAENLERMKTAGKDYFTKGQLPIEIGGIEKITLGEMYEKKLIVELKDKNGEACSADNSYISVEKFDDKYQMKVNLECGKQKDYVILTITCNELKVCDCKEVINSEKEYEYKKVSGGSWTAWGNWSEWSKVAITKLDNRDVDTKIEKETKTYNAEETVIEYKEFKKSCPSGYKLTADGKGCYKTTTDTKNPVCDKTANFISQNNFDCKYVEERELILTCPTGYVLSGNTCKQTVSELKVVDTANPVCPKKDGYLTTNRNGFDCTYTKYTKGEFIETVTGETIPADNANYVYVEVGTPDYVLVCNDGCNMQWVHIYAKYKSIVETANGKAECPKGYSEKNNTCQKYELQTNTIEEKLVCPVKNGYTLSANGTTCTYKKEVIKEATCEAGYKKVDNTCVKETTQIIASTKSCEAGYTQTKDGSQCEKEVTKTVTKTQVTEVTYYRYRLREYKNGTTLYKWSNSKNDKNLLNAGYKLTGKTR